MRGSLVDLGDVGGLTFGPVGFLGTTPNLVIAEKESRGQDASNHDHDALSKPLHCNMCGNLELVQKVMNREHQSDSDGDL